MKSTIRSLIGRIIMLFYIVYAYSEIDDEKLNNAEGSSEEYRYKTASSVRATLEMIIKKVEQICGLIVKKNKRAFL